MFWTGCGAVAVPTAKWVAWRRSHQKNAAPVFVLTRCCAPVPSAMCMQRWEATEASQVTVWRSDSTLLWTAFLFFSKLVAEKDNVNSDQLPHTLQCRDKYLMQIDLQTWKKDNTFFTGRLLYIYLRVWNMTNMHERPEHWHGMRAFFQANARFARGHFPVSPSGIKAFVFCFTIIFVCKIATAHTRSDK